MSGASRLNKASSYFFLFAAIISKLQYLPFAMVSTISQIVALISSLTAYSLWFISSHFNPQQTPMEHKWYGFAQFKKQHIYAASLGIVAAGLSITAIFIPIFIIPAVWLLVASNLIWTVSEYHKLKQPPESDKTYSPSKQKAYVSYSITLSLMAIVAALGTTLSLIFPVAALPILIASTIVTLNLGAICLHYWLDCNFGKHKPVNAPIEKPKPDAVKATKKSDPTDDPAPFHGKALFQKPSTTKNEPTKDNHLDQTCKSG